MARTRTADKNLHVTAVAEYQLFSDQEGGSWMYEAFKDAIDLDLIEEFCLLTVQPGIFGLQYCVFTVDLWTRPATDMTALKRRVAKVLNRVVGDTDVEVRFVAIV